MSNMKSLSLPRFKSYSKGVKSDNRQDKQTDRQDKNNMPPYHIDLGAYKIRVGRVGNFFLNYFIFF